MPGPIKFHAATGHRVSGGRADAYGSVDVHIDGSWEAFAHTSATPGPHIQGAGQRGTVVFFDGTNTTIFSKELWNFNINPGGDRGDNIAGGPNDIPANYVAAAATMGLAITDGSREFDWAPIGQALNTIQTLVQIIVTIAGN